MFFKFMRWIFGEGRHSWIYDNSLSRSCVKCGKQEKFSPAYGWYEVPQVDLKLPFGSSWVRPTKDRIKNEIVK